MPKHAWPRAVVLFSAAIVVMGPLGGGRVPRKGGRRTAGRHIPGLRHDLPPRRLTYYPLPNRREFVTRGPDWRSSFGIDAMHHLVITQN